LQPKGPDTDNVFAELGYSVDEIAAVRCGGTV
jgi:hypothetical protein